jgi:hypothetical protein
MLGFLWHIALRLMADAVLALCGWNTYKLFQSGIAKREKGNRVLPIFIAAFALGALTIWLFFALYPYWRLLDVEN